MKDFKNVLRGLDICEISAIKIQNTDKKKLRLLWSSLQTKKTITVKDESLSDDLHWLKDKLKTKLAFSELVYKGSGNFWAKHTYDSKGSNIKYEDSCNYCRKYTYDEKGNEIKRENSDNSWEKDTYNFRGNKIKYENSDNFWEKYTYDEKGKKIKSESSSGDVTIYKYDKNGDRVYEDKKTVYEI